MRLAKKNGRAIHTGGTDLAEVGSKALFLRLPDGVYPPFSGVYPDFFGTRPAVDGGFGQDPGNLKGNKHGGCYPVPVRIGSIGLEAPR
ncbi:hypothetical protein GCM10028803_04300 [Larkinella knui]